MNWFIIFIMCLLPSILVHAGEDNSSSVYTNRRDIEPVTNQIFFHSSSYECNAKAEVVQAVDKFIENQLGNFTIMEEDIDSELNAFFDKLTILLSENTTIYEEFIIKLLPIYLNRSKHLIEDIKSFEKYTVCNKRLGELQQFSQIVELRKLLDLGSRVLYNLDSYIQFTQGSSLRRKQHVNQFIEFFKTWKLVKTLVKQHFQLSLILREENPLGDLEKMLDHKRKKVETISYMIKCIKNIKNIYNEIRFFSIEQYLDIRQWEQKQVEWQRELDSAEFLYNRHTMMASFDFLTDTVQPVILGVVFLIGTLENVVLLLVFILNKDMRTATNASVINLTIADIISLAVNAFLFVFKLRTNWTFGRKLCKFYIFCEHFGFGLSVYSVVFVSFQRLLAVINISKLGRSDNFLLKKLGLYTPIAIVWIIAAAMGSQMLWYDDDDYIANYRDCSIGVPWEREQFVRICQFVFFCIVPLMIIGVMSIITSYQISKSIKNMPGEAVGLQPVIKARSLSSKIVLALTVVFIVSYFPYFFVELYAVLWFMPDSDSDIRVIKLLYAISLTRAMVFLNACFNPIALYLMSRNYRKYMNKYFTCGLASRFIKPSR